MKCAIPFRIILQSPPAGIDYGIQEGKGHQFNIVEKQRSTGQNLIFRFTLHVEEGKYQTWRFLGPIVQGPSAGKFIYIGIGTFAGQNDSIWSRRLKVPLSGITADILNALISNPTLILETQVQGIGGDGGPNCGTVKPFEGWKLSSQST